MPYYSFESLDSYGPGLAGFGTHIAWRVRIGISYTVERRFSTIVHKCVEVIIKYFTPFDD